MAFTTPLALLLLLVIPAVAYLGWPRVRFRRSRDIISLFLRVLMLLLVILALAGMQTVRAADKLAVVFLMDVSDSVGQTAREAEIDYVREAMASMAPDDLAGVIVFGGEAAVERQLSAVRELGPLRSTPSSGNTDLAEAIRLGLALFPPDTARRLVLLSDGQPTVGDTMSAAQLASAAGVEISYVPVSQARVPEVQVSDVTVPGEVNAGQQFDLSLTVDAEESTPATITVFASGEVIHRQEVDLNEGANRYTLTLAAGGSGFRDFRVMVEPDGADGFFQNNQLSTFSQVVGPPRALVISMNDDESRFLVDALMQSGLAVDVSRPNALPIGVAPLAQYDTVILDNVPATQLSPRRMDTLKAYVRDLGGGLVVIGGPNAYGPGGYFETPLEEALPVEMRLADQQRVPQLTIAYLIDRSGSMSMVGPSGVENLELGKEAIIRSIEFLQPTDRAGVASFDASGAWLADVQAVLDRVGLQNLVGTIRSGGGTDILAGMNLVGPVLANDSSPRKHIILLTDGGADPTDLIETTRELYDQYDVTTSVIAIGAGTPEQTFLDEMASAGGGNYHAVDVIEQIPTIFTLETVLATRSYIIEEEFVPAITSLNPMIEGIDSAPLLLGYVATTPKQTSQVVLVAQGEYNDPLLAGWQYGLGRSVAFTSDATARWAQNWVNWDDFGRFWNQVVRWTITEGTNENLETRVVMEGEQARLIVDARDEDGGFLNGLTLDASLIDPNLGSESVPLRQVAPGRYEAIFHPDAEGAYFLAVAGEGIGEDAPQVTERTGWVMSYSPEYSLRAGETDLDLLQEIADLTNGRALTEDAPAVFAHNLDLRTASTPLWPWLLLAALLLLPFDIAVRRLIITRSDLARMRSVIMYGRELATVPSERLSGLMGAKQRAQEKATAQGEVSSTAESLRNRRQSGRMGGSPAVPLRAEPPTTPPRAPRKPSPYAPTPPAPEGTTASRLLEKKKQRGEVKD